MGLATREAFGSTLEALGHTNPNIVVLDADLSGSTKTASFAKSFPDRFFNMGIAEQDMIGTAAGLAVAGKIPFAASFAVFATGRAYDQIRQSVAYSKKNVKIVGSHAGILTGEDGATHQMLEDISLMRGLENMIVLQPADAEECKQMVEFLASYEGPAYLRTGRAGVLDVHSSSHQFQLGKGNLLREGKDVCIIASGAPVHHALIASEKLLEKNISAQVINMGSLKPFDVTLTDRIAKEFDLIVTVEDHSITGGLGSCVAEVMAEHGAKGRLVRVGMTGFGESGTPEDLYQKYKLDAQGIFERITQELKV